jgi:hypothetical protein
MRETKAAREKCRTILCSLHKHVLRKEPLDGSRQNPAETAKMSKQKNIVCDEVRIFFYFQ